MVTIYDLFKNTADSFPDRNSIIFNDEKFTFSEISARINSFAHGLYKLGVRPRMTIGLLMFNGPDFFCLFYAAHKLGCALMPLNWRLTAEDQIDHINLSGCDVLIYEPSWAEKISGIKDRLSSSLMYISNGGAEEHALDEVFRSGEPDWQFDPGLNPDDPCLYLLTGGTSANSKIAVASQEKMVMRVLLPRLYNTLDYSWEDNFLTFNPMFHQGGVGIFLPVSIAGGCLTMFEKMDVEAILKAIEKYRVTRLLLLPPTLCSRIKASPELQKYDLSSVKCVMMSGGANSAALAEDVFRTFPNTRINTCYGATEQAAETMHTYSREEYRANRKLAVSIGRRSPFSQMKLLDEEGREVDPNTPGECYARSYAMFDGYIGRPDPFVDGYFPTGDYLEYDEEGYYFFRDRKNFLIKTGGECVIPSEVEQAIMQCPKVEKAAVFGMPDADFGERITAAVVLRPGESCTEEELTAFVRERIASYKKPRKVHFLSDLLYSSVGKLDKRALQKLCSELENN